jgi:hypothetical protein
MPLVHGLRPGGGGRVSASSAFHIATVVSVLSVAVLAVVPRGVGAVARGPAGAPRSPAAAGADAIAGPWMEGLISSPWEAQEAERAIVAADDVRFTAVFIDLLRASQTGALRTLDQGAIVRALAALSGKRFGDDWAAWQEWYRTTSLSAPPGYIGWKGRLFSRFDPTLQEFLKDGAPARIRVEEVAWAGVPVDGIPALTHPKTIPATSADDIDPSEPVVGLAINGYARAYPLRVLRPHELVNDRIGRVPVSVIYCDVSGASAAYEEQAPDGTTYTFGTSGLLYRSGNLMYDRETHTLWNELTGVPVIGPLAQGKRRLTPHPVVLTSWRAWLVEHPETKVLDPREGYQRASIRPVREYSFAGAALPLPHGAAALAPNAPVFALWIGGVPKAFPVDALGARRVVNDTVGGFPVVLVAAPVAGSRDTGRGGTGRGRSLAPSSAGLVEVRAYARGGEEFRRGADHETLADFSGETWWVAEDGLIGPAGARAPRVPGLIAHWFAWYELFPQTLLYSP